MGAFSFTFRLRVPRASECYGLAISTSMSTSTIVRTLVMCDGTSLRDRVREHVSSAEVILRAQTTVLAVGGYKTKVQRRPIGLKGFRASCLISKH